MDGWWDVTSAIAIFGIITSIAGIATALTNYLRARLSKEIAIKLGDHVIQLRGMTIDDAERVVEAFVSEHSDDIQPAPGPSAASSGRNDPGVSGE